MKWLIYNHLKLDPSSDHFDSKLVEAGSLPYVMLVNVQDLAHFVYVAVE